MKKKIKRKSFRVYEKNGVYSIIEVFSDANNNITGYSDYIYPIADSVIHLKISLSDMIKATRNSVLTDEDLKKVKS